MSTPSFVVTPMSRGFVAEVSGADVRSLDECGITALRRALNEHRVLVVRGQSLSAADQVEFSVRLGELYRMPYVRPLDDHPDVIAVLKEADEVKVSTFGSWWHADFSYLDEPPVYSVLHAVDLPPHGGDTLFADMIGAFEALSVSMRRVLCRLRIMHSGHIYGRQLARDGSRGRMRGVQISTGHEEAEVERSHPLVRQHEPTGRQALFANPTYCTRLANMSVEDSKSLLDFLYAHCGRPEFTWRQVWREGDLLLWDNRAVTHLAVNDYDGHRRLLHRTTVCSEKPVAAR